MEKHDSIAHLLARRLKSGFSLPPCTRAEDYHTPAVILALGLLATLAAVRATAHVLYPFPLDTGEGTIVDAAWRVSRGVSIYGIIGDKPPYFFVIYNPLLPYLAGLVVKMSSALWSARLLSVGFCCGSALVVYLFVRRETASRAAGLAAALFFLAERHICSRVGYVVTDWPGICFSLVGLYLWRRGGARRYWAVASFVLAFFSKQTSLMAAAAAFTSLFLDGKRKESAGFFALFLLAVAAGVALCALLFGRAYLVDTFVYAGIAPLEWHRSVSHVGVTLALYFVPAAGCVYFAARSFRDRSLLLPVIYFLFGLFLALMSGKVGASRSYVFDLAAALSIFAGLLWAKVETRILSGRMTFPILAVIILQIFLAAVGTAYRLSPFGDRTDSDFLHDSAIKSVYDSTDGVILTRETGFEFGSRARAVSNDTYKLRQIIEAGKLSPEILLAPVRDREFAAVIMRENEGPWIFFTSDLKDEVLRNYEIVKAEYGELFLTPLEESAEHNAQPVAP